ncbi:MAG: xylulokinase [Chloroflexia bacterium]|jgi:xylulokinase|nr:xylulokinase [Chloroflexia bacterium]
MAGKLLLGVDIGTSGSKAVLIDADGSVLATGTGDYPMYTPRPLWAEQDPRDWWATTVSAIRQALQAGGASGEDVAAVGLTGQMHGLVLLDEAGEVLRPCIMWNDQRTGPQCDEITRKLGLPRLLDLIANPALPGFTAPKIVWVREHEPEVYARARHVLLPKDYVRYRLTGEYAMEVSDGSGTALLDVRNRRWSGEMLSALDIPPAWLPECYESTVPSTNITRQAAEEIGLKVGTPVVGGGGDQAAGAVGSGIIKQGVISVTLGTSGVVFAATESFLLEPEGRLHAFCHAVPGRWHLMGVMLSAAGSLRWFRDTFGHEELARAGVEGSDVYDLLCQEASTAPAGSEGLIFLPYLTGERTPYPDPDAKGVFLGLTLRHGKEHMVRSVLEGVAFGLRDSLELMRSMGVEITQVRASGGGARSPLWRQILADVFNSEIVLTNVTEGAAYGAALIAGAGVGIYRDVDEACARTIRITNRVAPGPDVAAYEDYYVIYRSLYPVLSSHFKKLSKITAKYS